MISRRKFISNTSAGMLGTIMVPTIRPMTQGASFYTRARLQIGSFYLTPNDALSDEGV